jgi:DNA-binding MarR family transcriptional regulator
MNYKGKSTAQSNPRSKEAVRTWLRLLSCETVIEQRLRSLFRKHFSVTLPQFDVLSELERVGKPLTMSQLSRELMVSNGNVTGVIDRLEKSDFVERNRAEHDRRIQYIRLTAHGRKEFRKMARRHERWLEELLADLTITDMSSLQKLLLKTRNSVGGTGVGPQ